MKKIFLFLSFLAFAVFLLLPNKEAKGQETNYVADAVATLQTSNVYVAPNTPGTDFDTTSKLTTFLVSNDNIVLVMLPKDALTGTDLATIAQKISVGLDNQKTIGLAVGRDVIGYSPILPPGVASDKMYRASSV